MLDKKIGSEKELDLGYFAMDAIKESIENNKEYINSNNIDKFSLWELEEILSGPKPDKQTLDNYREKVKKYPRQAEN